MHVSVTDSLWDEIDSEWYLHLAAWDCVLVTTGYGAERAVVKNSPGHEAYGHIPREFRTRMECDERWPLCT